MAVVEEYQMEHCTAAIHDDAFAGLDEKTMERRRNEARRIAWQIWDNAQLRKRKEGTETT